MPVLVQGTLWRKITGKRAEVSMGEMNDAEKELLTFLSLNEVTVCNI